MKKIRFLALLLALALLLCACGAAKTPLEQAAAYLKKAAPNPGYGSLNGDWTVFVHIIYSDSLCLSRVGIRTHIGHVFSSHR